MKPSRLVIMALLLSSCLSKYFNQIDELQEAGKQNDKNVNTLNDFVISQACPPIVQVALKDIKDACTTAYTQSGGGGTCSPQAMANAIETFQRSAHRSLMADLMKMTHEVIYLQKDIRVPDKERVRRLQVLVNIPRLRQTRFRLAVSTNDGQDVNELTKQRLQITNDWLVSHNIPQELIDNPILYNFFGGKYPIVKTSLRIEDQPVPDSIESNVKVENGVWIFRIDCPQDIPK
jgi:hypothetical protein